jgi:hypothetical protein
LQVPGIVGYGDQFAELTAGLAAGEEQGGRDLGRETSRQTKAGSQILRGAGDCPYTP